MKLKLRPNEMKTLNEYIFNGFSIDYLLFSFQVVEEKVVKKQESLVSDLRHVLGRTEEDLRIAKVVFYSDLT